MSLLPARDAFLLNLLSKGDHKYRRYTGSPLRYAGGKSLAVGHIVEHLPDGITGLVSPFFGGGSVEIACANELGMSVTGYDVFEVLANYWRVQLAARVPLAARLQKLEPSKQEFAEVKRRLKEEWETGVVRDQVEHAAFYYFTHSTSYGPAFLGWPSSIHTNQKSWDAKVQRVLEFQAPNLSVQPASFEVSIPRHNGEFLYCDPPYYLEGDSKMFRGIYPSRNQPIHHKGFDHEELRNLLHRHRGGFLLSYNDCEVVRNWYARYRIIEVEWQYTMGQGETRIGLNRLRRGSGHTKKSHELIILG